MILAELGVIFSEFGYLVHCLLQPGKGRFIVLIDSSVTGPAKRGKLFDIRQAAPFLLKCLILAERKLSAFELFNLILKRIYQLKFFCFILVEKSYLKLKIA